MAVIYSCTNLQVDQVDPGHLCGHLFQVLPVVQELLPVPVRQTVQQGPVRGSKYMNGLVGRIATGHPTGSVMQYPVQERDSQ